MAPPTTRRLLLSCAAAAAALLAVVLATAAAATSSSPGYCAPGQAIPLGPLPTCRWYVASRTCGAAPLLPQWYLKDMCCRELAAVPAECRCKALRVMVEETPLESTAAAAAGGQACWLAQAQFAPAVVAEQECGLLTVHGFPFCLALSAED